MQCATFQGGVSGTAHLAECLLGEAPKGLPPSPNPPLRRCAGGEGNGGGESFALRGACSVCVSVSRHPPCPVRYAPYVYTVSSLTGEGCSETLTPASYVSRNYKPCVEGARHARSLARSPAERACPPDPTRRRCKGSKPAVQKTEKCQFKTEKCQLS
jgi:hypothetical protein